MNGRQCTWKLLNVLALGCGEVDCIMGQWHQFQENPQTWFIFGHMPKLGRAGLGWAGLDWDHGLRWFVRYRRTKVRSNPVVPLNTKCWTE
jgi:hypothetical protein